MNELEKRELDGKLSDVYLMYDNKPANAIPIDHKTGQFDGVHPNELEIKMQYNYGYNEVIATTYTNGHMDVLVVPSGLHFYFKNVSAGFKWAKLHANRLKELNSIIGY